MNQHLTDLWADRDSYRVIGNRMRAMAKRDTMEASLGRPTDISVVSKRLDDAIDQLGDIRAKGTQLRDLDRIYALLLDARAVVERLETRHAAPA